MTKTNIFYTIYGIAIFSFVIGYGVHTIPTYDKSRDRVRDSLDAIALAKANAITRTAISDKPMASTNTETVADKIVDKLGNKRYYNRDDVDYPVIIKFDPVGNNKDVAGALTISYTKPPTMGDNASSVGRDCNYYFTYTIQENRIIAVFKSSDCGERSANMTFTYDLEKDSFYMVQSSGKKLVFYLLD